jgi:hypothetical protein
LHDGVPVPVDPGFQEAIDRIHEVVAMELGVETQDAAAQHSLRTSVRHGQMPNRSEFGQGCART